MEQKLIALQEKVLPQIEGVDSEDALRELEVSVLGRKGELTGILRGLSDLSSEEKREFGKRANDVKMLIMDSIQKQYIKLEEKYYANLAEDAWLDVTIPGKKKVVGHMHPMTLVMNEIEDVFGRMGFDIIESQEIEKDYYNFTALNIPADHPAREMQDTFYIDNMEDYVLRTQTSNAQIRHMEKNKPPLRIVSPGKTYRKDSDATHSPMFHQFEGLMVDKNISIAHLRSVLMEFYTALLGGKVEVRFRTSYFPFVEPGLEVDVTCVNCEGKGKMENGQVCRVCKGSKWLEMAGAGMVHPQVLKNVDIDPEEYTGFAFGGGVERLAMIKYKMDDMRLLFNNDLRFLEQF